MLSKLIEGLIQLSQLFDILKREMMRYREGKWLNSSRTAVDFLLKNLSAKGLLEGWTQNFVWFGGNFREEKNSKNGIFYL